MDKLRAWDSVVQISRAESCTTRRHSDQSGKMQPGRGVGSRILRLLQSLICKGFQYAENRVSDFPAIFSKIPECLDDFPRSLKRLFDRGAVPPGVIGDSNKVRGNRGKGALGDKPLRDASVWPILSQLVLK